MANPIVLTYTVDELNEMFPCEDEDGSNVQASAAAHAAAWHALGVSQSHWGKLEWHLPNVFNVRYGSNYVATARFGEYSVRFLSDLGDWKEGDDQ